MSKRSRVYKFNDKKSSGSFVKSEIMPYQKLAEELNQNESENEKYIHLLKTIFGVLMLWICNY